MTTESAQEEDSVNKPRDSRDAAKQLREQLQCLWAQLDDDQLLDRNLKGLFFEIVGAFSGIEEGHVTSGSKQIADSLHSLIAHWPKSEVDLKLFGILGNTMRYGLALQGYPLASSLLPSLPRGQSR